MHIESALHYDVDTASLSPVECLSPFCSLAIYFNLLYAKMLCSFSNTSVDEHRLFVTYIRNKLVDFCEIVTIETWLQKS